MRSCFSALVAALALCACEQTEAPPAVSQVTSAPNNTLVATEISRGQRPDGRALLTLGVAKAKDLPVEGLLELTPEMQAEAMAVFNSTTAPCSPCMEEGISFSDCLLRNETTCRNLPRLGRRIVKAAAEGNSRHEIQPLVSYAEPWKPSIGGRQLGGIGRVWTDPLGDPVKGDVSWPISVVLAVDYADPFSRQMGEVWRTLAEDSHVVVYLLHLPHARHSGAEDLARGVVAAGEKAWILHTALLEGEEGAALDSRASSLGLDVDAWSAQRIAPETKAVMKAHARIGAELGIEATPVTLINGYPVVGVRSLDFLQTALNKEIADLEP